MLEVNLAPHMLTMGICRYCGAVEMCGLSVV
jgi:hypothetical protein